MISFNQMRIMKATLMADLEGSIHWYNVVISVIGVTNIWIEFQAYSTDKIHSNHAYCGQLLRLDRLMCLREVYVIITCYAYSIKLIPNAFPLYF